MPMGRRNIIAAIVLLGIGIWYGVLTAALPERTLPNTPGPSFFPWLITGFLMLLSAALLVQGIGRLKTEETTPPSATGSRRRVFALLWFAAYLAALPSAGFWPASIPFFAGLMVLYGARSRLVVVAVAVVVPLLLFFLFRYGFQIFLPRGVW